jgi:hypothetical protein
MTPAEMINTMSPAERQEMYDALLERVEDLDGAGLELLESLEKILSPDARGGHDGQIDPGRVAELIPGADPKQAADSPDGGGKPPPQSSQLLAIVEGAYDLGQTPRGEPFAIPKPGQGPYVARLLRGRGGSLRAELARRYAEKAGRIPSQQALADTLLAIQGRCLLAPKTELALRVARWGAGTVLDLGDDSGRAVVVTPDGWELVDRSPVLFRRTELTDALPEPKAGGRLEDLRGLLNVRKETWPLVVAWLLSVLLAPGIPHPVLMLGGEHGTAKSTIQRMLARLLDPADPQLRQPPRDVETWTIAAAGSLVVALDNLTGIPDWLSDAICRAVTGDGLIKRALYTDDGLAVLSFRRCVLLSGIAFAHLRSDLADRQLQVDCEPIGEEARRDDAEIEATFEAAWPGVLGGLLDLAVKVLAELPKVHLQRKPRMADFARIVKATDQVLQTDALDTYLQLQRQAAADLLEGDLVAASVQRFVLGRGSWEGTAGELLAEVTPERPPKGWPATPRAMAARLKRAAPTLRATGVQVDHLARTGQARRWALQAKSGGNQAESRGNQPSSPSQPSSDDQTRSSEAGKRSDGSGDGWTPPTPTVTPTVIGKPAGQTPSSDGPDGSDGSMPLLSAGRVCCSACGAQAQFDPMTDYGRRRLAEGHLECRAAWEPAS